MNRSGEKEATSSTGNGGRQVTGKSRVELTATKFEDLAVNGIPERSRHDVDGVRKKAVGVL